MYSNIVHTSIDMARLSEAVAGIDAVKRHLASLKGFKGAYWLQPTDGHGMAMSLWEDEATARAAAFAVGSSPATGVVVERVETRAVIAQA
jgi:heme-degrading monooxygenase HmoA